MEEIARVLGRAYATVFHAVTVLRACILAHSDTCGALLHDDPSMLQRVCSHRGRKTLRLDGHVPVFGIRENSGKAFVPVLPDVSPDFVLKLPVVDGRARDYYYGWIKAPLAERPGTLPDAINLEHRRLIEPDTGRFLHPEALTIVLREAGIDPQRETVVFCNVGHWSAAIWFALSEIAGFENVTLYDGSMVEWSASPERPVWIPEDPAWD